jgi:hypothetical protein
MLNTTYENLMMIIVLLRQYGLSPDTVAVDSSWYQYGRLFLVTNATTTCQVTGLRWLAESLLTSHRRGQKGKLWQVPWFTATGAPR